MPSFNRLAGALLTSAVTATSAEPPADAPFLNPDLTASAPRTSSGA